MAASEGVRVGTRREFVDQVIERLAPLDVTAKPMFGEYGLYHRGQNVALVCDDTLFVKVTPAGEALAGRVGRASPYPGAKPAIKVSRAKLADRAWLTALVEATSAAMAAKGASTRR